MKTVRQTIIGAVVLFFVSAIQTFAIEGLRVSVQSTNAVLSWPSLTNETYIAQYRQTLSATDSWVTLTNYLPPAGDTNITFFVHSNIVQYPFGSSGGGTNGAGSIDPNGTNNTNNVSGGTNGFKSTTGFYRVVRDGAHMWGITNGMVLHDELITPIEFAVDSTDQVVGVTFYDENNSPIIGATAQPLGGNGWLLVWNTTLSFNGDYSVYAELNFASDSSVASQPVTVTVTNAISFPNYFTRIFGDQMWIYAETIPDAAYTIDMYDENTNYLGTFADSADDGGVISFTWDLTDGEGDTFDSTNFYGVFTVDNSSSDSVAKAQVQKLNASSPSFQTLSPAKKTFKTSGNNITTSRVHFSNAGSSASATQFWVQEKKWTPNDNWVVAYGLFSGQSGESSQKDIYMIAGGVDEDEPYKGVLGTLDDWGLNSNVSPGNNPSAGTVFTLQDQSSRTNLLNYLADHRYENFYFFGHGNDSSIGSYNGFTLTSDQIGFALDNVPLSFSGQPELINVDPPIIVYPQVPTQIKTIADHPYRFVVIDACDTAAGNFCEAFAIPAITVSTNYFRTLGVESRAFVGFKSWALNLNFLTWQSYSLMTSGFLFDWLDGHDVQTCVNDARNGYGSGASMDSSVWIYGAYDLKHDTRTRP
jgi:hypothetical protein